MSPKVSNKTEIEACAIRKWSTTIDPTYPFALLPRAPPHVHLLSYEAGGEETNKACCTTLARNFCKLEVKVVCHLSCSPPRDLL